MTNLLRFESVSYPKFCAIYLLLVICLYLQILEATMDLDEPKKISTHGRRLSRNQEWRAAKGLPVLKKGGKLNRKGELSAPRRAGRSKRRR